MSRPSASPSPERRARRPAPTAPPAGPESTLQAPARAASASGATPPEDCMTSGSGSPRSRRALGEPREVGGRAAGRGRRRSPSSSSARTRETAAAPRARPRRGRRAAPRAGARRSRASWARARGRRRAGRSRPTRRRARASSPDELVRLALGERVDHALGPDPLGRLEAQVLGGAAARAWARRGGRGWGGPGARSRAGRRSPRSRPARCARRAPRAARWCRRSSRGRSPRPSPASAPAALEHRLDGGDHALRLVVGRRSAALAVWSSPPSKQDGVGERPADVDSEQHRPQATAPWRGCSVKPRRRWDRPSRAAP